MSDEIKKAFALVRCMNAWASSAFPNHDDIDLALEANYISLEVADEETASAMVCDWGTEPGDDYYEVTKSGLEIFKMYERQE